MSIEDASRCVEGSVELYIELYIEDVEARTQRSRALPIHLTTHLMGFYAIGRAPGQG